MLALVLGLIVSAGLYFAYLWPSVEPLEEEAASAAVAPRAAALPPQADQWRREPVAGGQRFKDLQARAQRLGKTLPSDQSLANSQELLQALPRSCVAPVDPQDAVQARERIVQRAEAAEKAATI